LTLQQTEVFDELIAQRFIPVRIGAKHFQGL